MNPKLFEGKTALITGASRGIGRAFALDLAYYGADIILNYCGNDEAANRTRLEIESLGRRCTLAKADLSLPNCAELIFSVCTPPDLLILNASVQFRQPWEAITVEAFDAQMHCNVRAALLLIQKAIPAMRAQKWGRIVTIGSVQETKPHPDMLVYSASKAAVTAIAKSLAAQLAPHGITVNSIAPGVVETDRNTAALADPDYRSTVIAGIPAGYLARPEDCVSALRFLCSEESRYVTGQNIFVDGGKSL